MIGTIPYFPQSPLITSFDSLKLPRTLSRSLLYTPSSTPFLFFPTTPYHSLPLPTTPSYSISSPLILCQPLFLPHSLPLLPTPSHSLSIIILLPLSPTPSRSDLRTPFHIFPLPFVHALACPHIPYHSLSLHPTHFLSLPLSLHLTSSYSLLPSSSSSHSSV